MTDGGIVLAVVGDVCSDRGLRPLFDGGDPSRLFGFAAERIASADLAVANLECPLTSGSTPIRKIGPCLSGPIATARVLSRAGFSAVSLANNHILDHGAEGLRSTLLACAEAGISTVGAGESEAEARRPLVLERKGIRVGILAMAEAEFSIASEAGGGANGIDAERWTEDLAALKPLSDFILVLLHAGKENHPLPSPRTQRLCRSLIEHGAGMVVCQHSHCVGAREEYRGGSIVYGQGNCLFDPAGAAPDTWNTGVILEVRISGSGAHASSALRTRQSTKPECLRPLTGPELAAAEAAQAEWDALVVDPEAVGRAWRLLARRDAPRLLYSLGGYGGFMIRVLYRLGFHRLLYGTEARMTALNLLRCQTHRELLETFLREE